MKKTVEALRAEILQEQFNLENQAFEIYCKRELEHQMNCVSGYKKDWDSSVERLESLTIDELKRTFNSYSPTLIDSPKNSIIKELKEKNG